ncbi:DUF3606 domain-containing protein [Bradyrhizobium sp. 35]|uniref:DUF3606 domain-containing protein n=1 Tax=Bradyrhizobium sp. 35 TaxID=2782670 RepID=UPI001FFAC54C
MKSSRQVLDQATWRLHDELRKAVDKVGNSAAAVRKELAAQPRRAVCLRSLEQGPRAFSCHDRSQLSHLLWFRLCLREPPGPGMERRARLPVWCR